MSPQGSANELAPACRRPRREVAVAVARDHANVAGEGGGEEDRGVLVGGRGADERPDLLDAEDLEASVLAAPNRLLEQGHRVVLQAVHAPPPVSGRRAHREPLIFVRFEPSTERRRFR